MADSTRWARSPSLPVAGRDLGSVAQTYRLACSTPGPRCVFGQPVVPRGSNRTFLRYRAAYAAGRTADTRRVRVANISPVRGIYALLRRAPAGWMDFAASGLLVSGISGCAGGAVLWRDTWLCPHGGTINWTTGWRDGATASRAVDSKRHAVAMVLCDRTPLPVRSRGGSARRGACGT